MKKLLGTVAVVAAAVQSVSGASAYFTSTAVSDDNTFQAGTAVIQVANDNDLNGVADGAFSSTAVDTWDSPTNWVPFSGAIGDPYNAALDVREGLMVRSAGTADFESVLQTVTNYATVDGAVIADGSDMGDAVIVLDATFNATNILTAAVLTACDLETFNTVTGSGTTPGADGLLSLAELNACAPTLDLVDGAGIVLPGSVTNPVVGGAAGTGLQLVMTFRFHPAAGNDYQNDQVEVDFNFLGATSEI
jgi:predicted ribosomally synthesized peptide with SipW-like signal peptide